MHQVVTTPIEQSLSTATRAHLISIIASITVLMLATPGGRDPEAAADTLASLDGIVGPYAEIACRDVAQEAYRELTRSFVEYAAQQPGPDTLPARFEVGGFAGCERPEGDFTPAEFRSYLYDPVRVHVASPDFAALLQLVRDRSAAGDGELVGVVISVHGPNELEYPISFVSLKDPHLVPALPAARRDRLAGGQDSLTAHAIHRGADGTLGEISAHALPGEALRATGGFADNALMSVPDRVLRPRQSDFSNATYSDFMPDVMPFWDEVSTLPVAEAIRYLRAQAGEEQGTVEVLGLRVSTTTLGWAGPFILVLLGAYILIQLRHLARLDQQTPQDWDGFWWFALYRDRLAVLVTWVSLFLPVASVLAVALRTQGESSFISTSAWVGVAVLLVLGIASGVTLGRLRREQAPTASQP